MCRKNSRLSLFNQSFKPINQKHFPPNIQCHYITAPTWSVFGVKLRKKIDKAGNATQVKYEEPYQEPLNDEPESDQVEADANQVGEHIVQADLAVVQVAEAEVQGDESRAEPVDLNENAMKSMNVIALIEIVNEVSRSRQIVDYHVAGYEQDEVRLWKKSQYVCVEVENRAEKKEGRPVEKKECRPVHFDPNKQLVRSNGAFAYAKDPMIYACGHFGKKNEVQRPDPPSVPPVASVGSINIRCFEGKEFNKIPP